MCDIIIREAKLKDITNIVVVKQQVWIDTYATDGVRSEFSEYVINEFTVDNEEALFNNPDIFTLVAEYNNHIVGLLQLNYSAEAPVSGVTYPEITVLYVLRRFCRQGIGVRLQNEAEKILKESGRGGYWLSVYSGNESAIRFYLREGHSDAGHIYFKMDGNSYENRIMVKQF